MLRYPASHRDHFCSEERRKEKTMIAARRTNNRLSAGIKRTPLRRWLRFMPLYMMMLPGLAYLIINNYIPMAGIVIAFKKMDYRLGMFLSPWVGLKNFEFLFRTKDAWLITRNTILYNLVFITLGIAVSVTVAVLLNEIRQNRARKAYQTIILMPFMVSIIITSYLVYGFLSQESGFLNKSILPAIHKAPVAWYAQKQYWPVILTLVNLWKSFGYGSVVYFATIVGFDRSFYESATIDGAGRWKQITCITLPLLKPVLIIMVLMSISKIFYSDFGLFYQIPRNSGPLIDVTNTIDTYVYRGLVRNNNVGMFSAANFYQAVIGFVLVLTANLTVKKMDAESSLF